MGEPAGGRSSTYYALLQHAATAGKTVYSVERSIEYEIPAVAQVLVNPGSPVGAASYFAAGMRQDTDVLAIDISTQTRRVVTRFPFRTTSFAASPDLKRVAIEEPLAAGRRALLVRDLDTGREARLAEGLVYDGIRFSPDGSTLLASPSVTVLPRATDTSVG